jgi:O-antigen biosynthesis protein
VANTAVAGRSCRWPQRAEKVAIDVNVVPWVVETRAVKTPLSERSGLAFIGGYRHSPNVDAARLLAGEIMPQVAKLDASIVTRLVGSHIPDELARYEVENIKVLGKVPDLDDLFAEIRLTVAPLRYGAGVKGKVLDSFAAGIPCLMTEIAAEGLALPARLKWLVTNSIEEMATKIVELHNDFNLNAELSNLCLDFMRRGFSRKEVDRSLRTVVAHSEGIKGPDRRVIR